MKKLITANDIREAHARGEQAMSVVLRASIITPEASASAKPSLPSCRKASLPKAWSHS